MQVLATQHIFVHQLPKLVLSCPLVRPWVTTDVLLAHNHLLFNKTPVVTLGNALVSTQHQCTQHQCTQQTNRFNHYNPYKNNILFFTNNQEEHCKSLKRPNFTSTTNGNQTTKAKTFSIPATTKNKTVKRQKRLPFPSKIT